MGHPRHYRGTLKRRRAISAIRPRASIVANAIRWLRSIIRLLERKNKSYGNSAGDPLKIFSQSGPLERLNSRIDDKLSRLMRGKEFQGEDTIMDLVGYLALRQGMLMAKPRTRPSTHG
jgi:hypothetical protein